MDLQTAAAITRVMLDVSAQLDASVRLVQDDANPSEFDAYRRCVGNLMGQIYCDVLSPIFKEHPQLTPAQLTASQSPNA